MAVEADLRAACLLYSVEAAQEIGVEVGAPELAIGDALETEILLEGDHPADCLVLRIPERCGIDLARTVRRARFDELGWPQETADMVGAERRLGYWIPLGTARI